MVENLISTSSVVLEGPELSICDRDPIHAPGAIQPYGALLALDFVIGRVTHASANLAAFLAVPAEAALGRPIADLLGEDSLPLLTLLDQRARAAAPGVFFEARGELKRDGGFLHLRAHGSGRRVCIDMEHSKVSRASLSVFYRWQHLIDSFAEANNTIELCEQVVRGLKSITGFDHVLAYRFGEAGHGEVIAEARAEGLVSYLGVRFPAGDLPQQARELYLRQRVGNIENCDDTPVALLADPAPDNSEPLDLTRSVLRCYSPLHLEYMRNMGTVATLRIGLVQRGVLWGLLVCNHMSPRPVDPQMRAVADMIGQMISLLLGSLGSAELLVQRQARGNIFKALLGRLATPMPLFEALAAAQSELLDLMVATGAILRGSGKIFLLGRTPPRPMAERLLATLCDEATDDIFAVNDLGIRHPEFANSIDSSSGALLSKLGVGYHGDAIIWLRPEQAQTVVWGGDPTHHINIDGVTGQVHPRASFAAWRESVTGRSAPWTEVDRSFAVELRAAIESESAFRIKAELALKSTILDATLQHMNLGIMMIDADHRILVCNGLAAKSLGLTESFMDSGPRLQEVVEASRAQSADNDIGQELRDFLTEACFVSGPSLTERRGSDGVVYLVRSMPMSGGGFVSTFGDITVQKEAEAILQMALDQAQAANLAKSEFLATMSHEIRSPLSGLLGVIELLRETKLEPEQLDMSNMAHDSASGLLAVLNDILTFSKIEATGLAIIPEPVGLRHLVRAVAEPHKLEAARKGVELTWSFDPEMPDCVSIDPLRLRQIVNNLFSNAVKFTKAGKIDLTVERATMEPAAQMSFTFRDTGIGMTEAVLNRLFQPFVQADASTTRDFGGTGLGLSISFRLAEMLGGSLAATSVSGQGSAFVLTLPLHPAQMAEVREEANAEPASILAEGSKVLVVDDNATMRWLTSRQLTLLGVGVETAENGEMALQMLRAGQFDLVLTDCHMPRMDGIALTRAMRAESDLRLRGLPVVGLTADVTETQRTRAFEAGMVDLAIKPLSRLQLAHLLACHLPSGRMRTASESLQPIRQPVAFDKEIYEDVFSQDDPEGRAWLAEYFAMAEPLIGDLRRFANATHETLLPRQEIAESAHALAGASLSVGATRLGEEARALQHTAISDPAAQLVERMERLQDELAAARIAVSEFFGDGREVA
jgi:light-regulated signal transduction histidine kinase (bacteriophytochrome)/CheY-like chemotaxis protein